MSKHDTTILRAKELLRTNWIHALHILRDAADENPQEPKFQVAIGDILASRRTFDKALQHYLIALSLDPSNQQVLALIGNCYLSSGDYRLALAYFQKIVNPEDDILYNIAIAQAFLGKHEECVCTLKEILPRFPNHPFIYYLIVEQYYYLSQFETALEYIDTAKHHAGEHHQLYLLNAMIYSSLKRPLLAFDQYKKADAMNPINNSDQLLNYAMNANKSGLWQEAITIYLRITNRFPYISESWVEIIKIYLDREDYNQARRYLDLAKRKIDRPNSTLRLLQKRLKDST